MRKDYRYSHGIYTNTKLQYCCLSSETDYLIALFERDNKQYISIAPVSTLPSHTMMGLKGVNTIKLSNGIVCSWHNLTKGQSENIPNLIAVCQREGFVDCEKSTHQNEVLWINKNLFNILIEEIHMEQAQKIPVDERNLSSEDFDFSTLIGYENQGALRDKFMDYIKIARTIRIGQSHVKDVLAACKNKDDFWNAIGCLLDCDVNIFRTPIVNYFKAFPEKLYMPDTEDLISITGLLFSIDEKIEKNLEFLFPFKSKMSEEIMSIIQAEIQNLSRPEYYHLYGKLLDYSPKDMINYCLDNKSITSYYCIYEILQERSKIENPIIFDHLVDYVIKNMDGNPIEGNLIIKLIRYEFKIGRGNKKNKDIVKIKYGGYEEFSKICKSHYGKEKVRKVLSNLPTFVGKTIKAKYISTYQNHYFLMGKDGVRILLPKQMANDEFKQGDSADVFIAMADKYYETLYATQKQPVDYAKIKQIPLLNNGDIVELTFDVNGRPSVRKCYKKISVSLDSSSMQYYTQIRYRAKVLQELSDKYHYEVKIVGEI